MTPKPVTRHPSLVTSLQSHLADWGLRRFESDADYFQWQRQTLSSADLARLHQAVQEKQAAKEGSEAEIAFYDLSATPHFVPPLYSQRYDYYLAVGPRVAQALGNAGTVLDVGCGIGVLTSWYARQFPERTFVGMDRSSASVALAAGKAKALGLTNVRFECLDIERDALAGSFGTVIATHVLVQAEQDLGVPSKGWETFERAQDPQQQAEFERRTGIGLRLDALGKVMAADGRLILFEKTRQLARRVPFQRALAMRGLAPAERPEPIRYRLVEEVADDGPFFVVTLGSRGKRAWDESPEDDEPVAIDLVTLAQSTGEGDAPLHENHTASAQRLWEQLPAKHITTSFTREEPDGRQLHAELGTSTGLMYLYVANTFDQRQLVLIEPARAAVLESYYREIERGGG
jgi:SAM-dependent methyltransferase